MFAVQSSLNAIFVILKIFGLVNSLKNLSCSIAMVSPASNSKDFGPSLNVTFIPNLDFLK